MPEFIIVDLPDGTQAEFPAGTPKAEMKAAIQKRFPPPKAPTVAPAPRSESGYATFEGFPGFDIPEGGATPFGALPWPPTLAKVGRATLNTAPAAGMLLGGAAGTVAATFTGPAAPAMPYIGSGLGAGTGMAVKQGIEQYLGIEPPKTMPEQAATIGKEAAIGAIAPAAVDAAVVGAGKVIAPFAGDISVGTKLLIDKARAADLPIPAKAFVGNLSTRGLQWVGESLLPGKLLSEHYRNKLTDRLAALRSEAIGEATGTLPYFQGASLAEGGAAAKLGLKRDVDAAYSAGREMLPNVSIPVPETRQILGALSQNPKVMKDKRLFEWVSGWLHKTEKTGLAMKDDFPKLYAQINTRLNKLSNGGDPMFKALEADLSTWDKAEGANIVNVFSEAKTKARDKFGFDSVYSVFNKATKRNNEGQEYFMPSVARAELTRQSDQIKRSYGDGTIRQINEFLDLTEAAARGTAKMPSMGSVPDLALGGGAFAGGGPLAVAVPYGTSFAVTHSLTSPKGYMKRWLLNTKKINMPPSLRAAGKLGTFELMQPEQD